MILIRNKSCCSLPEQTVVLWAFNNFATEEGCDELVFLIAYGCDSRVNLICFPCAQQDSA